MLSLLAKPSYIMRVTMITFKNFQRYSVIGIKNMNNGFRMTWIINFFLHNKDEAISHNFVHGEEPGLDGPTFLSRLFCYIISCFLQSELINSKKKNNPHGIIMETHSIANSIL